MTANQEIIWQRIKRFEIDNPAISFSFTDRLCRENGWTTNYALRVTAEYKKFIFLLAIANHPLTPSDQVDQVWHLHLLYTESYWNDFCENFIGKKIHHGPTQGGDNERDKFENWYEKTKSFYLEIFEIKPPIDIWPSSEIRFADINFQRVNLNKNWIFKKLF